VVLRFAVDDGRVAHRMAAAVALNRVRLAGNRRSHHRTIDGCEPHSLSLFHASIASARVAYGSVRLPQCWQCSFHATADCSNITRGSEQLHCAMRSPNTVLIKMPAPETRGAGESPIAIEGRSSSFTVLGLERRQLLAAHAHRFAQGNKFRTHRIDPLGYVGTNLPVLVGQCA